MRTRLQAAASEMEQDYGCLIAEDEVRPCIPTCFPRGVLSRGAQPGEVINIARSYGREMYVLTVLQRTGDVKPITLSVLSTVWNWLKGSGGTTFERLAAKL